MSWQPIETAPRDGTDVLVLLDSAGVPVVHIAWWRSREEWERSGQYSGGWSSLEEWEGWWSYTRNSISQEKLDGYATPTHWQPLPAPQSGLPCPTDGPAVPEGREPASVVSEPSEEELLELMPETMRDEFAYAATTCSDATGGQVKPGIFRVCLNTAALEFARAVLARHGRPAPAPVGERQAAPVPVATSDRLPQPEDCDAEGRCWAWRSFDPEEDDSGDCWMTIPCEWLERSERWTHWLPATALPLPQQETPND